MTSSDAARRGKTISPNKPWIRVTAFFSRTIQPNNIMYVYTLLLYRYILINVSVRAHAARVYVCVCVFGARFFFFLLPQSFHPAAVRPMNISLFSPPDPVFSPRRRRETHLNLARRACARAYVSARPLCNVHTWERSVSAVSCFNNERTVYYWAARRRRRRLRRAVQTRERARARDNRPVVKIRVRGPDGPSRRPRRTAKRGRTIGGRADVLKRWFIRRRDPKGWAHLSWA